MAFDPVTFGTDLFTDGITGITDTWAGLVPAALPLLLGSIVVGIVWRSVKSRGKKAPV